MLTARTDALLALTTAPFVVACLLLIVLAIGLAASLDRPRIGRTSPETEARRQALRDRAFGGRG